MAKKCKFVTGNFYETQLEGEIRGKEIYNSFGVKIKYEKLCIRLGEKMKLSETAKSRLITIKCAGTQSVHNSKRSLDPMKELENEGLVTISKPDKDNDVSVHLTEKGRKHFTG